MDNMNNEEKKIQAIMDMLDEAEEKLNTLSLESEDYGYVAGMVDALNNVLDVLQGE